MRRALTQADIEEFRERVCVVATEILAEMGEEQFNMRQLAGRLGVSAMTAYRYFRDKSEIVAAVRAQTFARLADRLGAVQDAPGSMQRILAALSQVYVDFAREEQVLYRSMFDLSGSRAAAAPELRRNELRAREAFTAPLRRLANAGLCKSDPDLIGQVLWSFLHGAMALSLAGELSDTNRDRMIFETIRMLALSASGAIEFQSLESLNDRPSFRANGSANHPGKHEVAQAPAFDSAQIS
ncbi:MAG TPA: TetR/AcrR family transcriptional regulator [Rhizomicrobium sp.]|jgi:AcrR family transcriptional regulator